ncbi:flagellar basal-body rod protein FlgF [Bartonella sp. DGB2]|uniref:flagellar basal-body rod protein FlgF n=1 Tax=Bartonella sp. DGB2 TaxID=3388426 RepID=UPI003990020A
MKNPIYIGISGQLSLARQLNTIAQNIANVNTPGFHGTAIKFETLLSPTARNNNTQVNFVTAGKGYITREHGAFTQTGNALDVAIDGNAYFALQTPAGPVYTRDGRMNMTAEGDLLSVTGLPFLDDGGAPLQLNPALGAPVISVDGAIYQNHTQVAKIGLFQIPSEGNLRYGPNASVVPDRPAVPAEGGTGQGVMQGYIESANVNGVLEMTRLIEVSRAFERMEAMLRQQEDMTLKSIQIFGGRRT